MAHTLTPKDKWWPISASFTADVNQMWDNFISIALYLKGKYYTDKWNANLEALLKGGKSWTKRT